MSVSSPVTLACFMSKPENRLYANCHLWPGVVKPQIRKPTPVLQMRKDKTDLIQLVKDKDEEVVQVPPKPTIPRRARVSRQPG